MFTTGDRDDLLSYQIVGDNVDMHQRATHHSMERTDRDHHWFHLYAVQDRISGQSLPDDAPTADIATLPLQTFLPSADECHQLRKEFGILISRVLVRELSFFSQFKDHVPEHIQHQHSADTSNKSEIVRTDMIFIHSTTVTKYLHIHSIGSTVSTHNIHNCRFRWVF